MINELVTDRGSFIPPLQNAARKGGELEKAYNILTFNILKIRKHLSIFLHS